MLPLPISKPSRGYVWLRLQKPTELYPLYVSFDRKISYVVQTGDRRTGASQSEKTPRNLFAISNRKKMYLRPTLESRKLS